MNINLLPWREQRTQKIFHQFLLQMIVSVLMIISFFIFLHFILLSHYPMKFSTQEPPFWQKALVERKHFLPTLRTIINALPKNCYLTQLSYHKQWAITGQTADTQSLQHFIRHLKQRAQFHHTLLTNVSSQKPFTYHVVIQ